MSKRFKAELILIIVALCWGISYVLMDVALAGFGAFTLNAVRFLGAFFIAFVLLFPRMRNVNQLTIKYSMLIGLTLVLVYAGATFGVMYTSLSNAGFLCALSCVFTPVFGYLFKGQRPGKKFASVVLLCTVGAALMSLNEEFRPALGDILCLGCGLFYAADLLMTESAVTLKDVDVLQLGVYELGFTGIFNLILAFVFEEPSLLQTPVVWGSTLFLAVFCTGLAFIAQTVAQQYTSASRVGIIFTLEPVFSAVAAFFIAHEILRPRAYAGAVMMVIALVIMEIDFSRLKPKE